MFKETPPLSEEQHINVTSDNETSINGFIKYLDMSKIPLCVSTFISLKINFDTKSVMSFYIILLATNLIIADTYFKTNHIARKLKYLFLYEV